MKAILHFVPKKDCEVGLEQQLRSLGFSEVRRAGDRVLVRADVEDVAKYLGVSLQSTQRERKVGLVRERVQVPVIPTSATLPPTINDLVDRWYVPLAPDRIRSAR